MKGIFVETGKYRQELAESSDVEPDKILESVAELDRVLD